MMFVTVGYTTDKSDYRIRLHGTKETGEDWVGLFNSVYEGKQTPVGLTFRVEEDELDELTLDGPQLLARGMPCKLIHAFDAQMFLTKDEL